MKKLLENYTIRTAENAERMFTEEYVLKKKDRKKSEKKVEEGTYKIIGVAGR